MIKTNLKSMREKHGKGISQAQLARAVEVSRFYISKIENQKIRPNAELMFKIARHLGYKVDDIFWFKDEEE